MMLPCDGNVTAVTQAAAAEIAKIKLLQSELQSTVVALSKEQVEVVSSRKTLEGEWRQYQQQIETALSPDFAEARKKHTDLIESARMSSKPSSFINALGASSDGSMSQRQHSLPTSRRKRKSRGRRAVHIKICAPRILKTVEKILNEWHFPDATDVYFDEGKRDVVIGGRLRGSRGAGLCAITYSAFTIALFEFCRSRNMPHPGFVILDSPLIAYKEPKADDEGISGRISSRGSTSIWRSLQVSSRFSS